MYLIQQDGRAGGGKGRMAQEDTDGHDYEDYYCTVQ